MTSLRVPLLLLLLAALTAGVAALAVTDDAEPDASPQDGEAHASWQDGQVHGPWRTVYTGYGEVSGSQDEVLLHPRSARSQDVTHGGLVPTRATYADPDFTVSLTTEAQVRKEGPPSPWEVGWVLWNVTDDDHFYAVALKPNGWEVSKQDPAYPGKQRFLVTGNEPTFAVGVEHRVEVRHEGGEMVVSANGQVLARVTDTERPYSRGAIGLYTEDARVHFTDLVVTNTGAADHSSRGN